MVKLHVLAEGLTTNHWSCVFGVVGVNAPEAQRLVGSDNSYGYAAGTGGLIHKFVESTFGAPYGPGDQVALCLDFPNQSLTFFKNGVSQGSLPGILNSPVRIACSLSGTIHTCVVKVVF